MQTQRIRIYFHNYFIVCMYVLLSVCYVNTNLQFECNYILRFCEFSIRKHLWVLNLWNRKWKGRQNQLYQHYILTSGYENKLNFNCSSSFSSFFHFTLPPGTRFSFIQRMHFTTFLSHVQQLYRTFQIKENCWCTELLYFQQTKTWNCLKANRLLEHCSIYCVRIDFVSYADTFKAFFSKVEFV